MKFLVLMQCTIILPCNEFLRSQKSLRLVDPLASRALVRQILSPNEAVDIRVQYSGILNHARGSKNPRGRSSRPESHGGDLAAEDYERRFVSRL